MVLFSLYKKIANSRLHFMIFIIIIYFMIFGTFQNAEFLNMSFYEIIGIAICLLVSNFYDSSSTKLTHDNSLIYIRKL